VWLPYADAELHLTEEQLSIRYITTICLMMDVNHGRTSKQLLAHRVTGRDSVCDNGWGWPSAIPFEGKGGFCPNEMGITILFIILKSQLA
jgi:hypothetical protein